MAEQQIENVVIVGSGPAAWSAAIYTARAELKPLVFEGAITEDNRQRGTLPLGQLALTTEVENFAGFPAGDLSGYFDTAFDERKAKELNSTHHKKGVSGPELMELMRQQAKNFGTRIVTDDIVSCDLSQRPFTLKTLGGKEVQAQAVIVATGARANYLGLPSEDKFKNMGVSACAVCDGALPRFRNKPLVVVGGGDSAMEEATFLTKFASTVYIVHRRDEFRASRIMAERALKNEKIEVKWNSVIDEVLGDDKNGVTGVRIRSSNDDSQTEELEAAGYFAAIGHTPNVDFLDGQVELKQNGYIQWTTPFRTNTSVEGVFAAGDVADDYYKQAITAAGSGCQAALDAERWLAEQE
ncbi:NAD(P)/FAD-dependent oxidoreductase [Rubinisphaera brasiliensis]|uniref:Thioredoxin reductase n=1 Tax=Rubinisphaera brasiliensis (strain ATCC 49424 / DSM 5305 / JCM 21570 / IAM 15109 / NBRC 103401 / IFAM 1448) TaxID=756272 RepID=F0SQK1_RUBBR|nr:thioredoxin-disulfide reductase [Rubinisphaera brasiliensis]ADY57976.1 thioredoxin reductase [Rubinisphaera brasiliensis DSM 5305]